MSRTKMGKNMLFINGNIRTKNRIIARAKEKGPTSLAEPFLFSQLMKSVFDFLKFPVKSGYPIFL